MLLEVFQNVQRLHDGPLPKGKLQLAAFDMRQKMLGCQQTLLWMLPPGQRFHADDLARLHVYLGLDVQHKFMVVQPLQNALALDVVFSLAAIFVGIKSFNAVAPGLLGLVHGLIGMAYQCVRIAGIIGDLTCSRYWR